MLDFKESDYKRITDLAIKNNIIANCREYPSLSLNRMKIDFNYVKRSLRKKFSNKNFACGLYVHFPYCATRCSFCKYFSEIPQNIKFVDNFIDLIKKEIKSYDTNFKKVELDNLFFGGGTPTMLSLEQFEKYYSIIDNNFKFKQNAQKSIEGTPETLNFEKLKLFKKLGINRLSIGMQSSSNEVLRNIGRKHTYSDVARAFFDAREAGFKYVGTEVIWGLPGETEKSYLKTIEDVIKLSPEYIEGYYLTTGGRVRTRMYVPRDVDINRMIEYYRERLLDEGYRVYSKNNFFGMIKKNVLEKRAINQNTDGLYNYRTEIFGIGPGSSSHFKDFQYNVVSNINKYSEKLNDNRFPDLYGVIKSQEDYMRLYVIMQIGYFRSINKRKYKNIFGKSLSENFPAEIACLKEKRVIKETKNNYLWLLDENEMGHKSFFEHVLKYWYNKEYVNDLLRVC